MPLILPDYPLAQSGHSPPLANVSQHAAAASLRVAMTLPLFPPDEDPGPSFVHLLAKLGLSLPSIDDEPTVPITHGTTIVALRYADGVVMAGDRRAPAGSPLSPPG